MVQALLIRWRFPIRLARVSVLCWTDKGCKIKMMRECRITLSCLLIGAVLVVGLVLQDTPTPLTVTLSYDGFQFADAHGYAVEPLATRACLTEPKGTRIFACAHIDGYVVWAEGQIWDSPDVVVQDEAEETEGVTTVVSGTLLVVSAVTYEWVGMQEPHNEQQRESILVPEPPRYLPPKRQSRLLV
jgi:hypothetical protein